MSDKELILKTRKICDNMAKNKKRAMKSKERKEAWFRILVLIVTGIVLVLWRHLVFVLVIVNWFIAVFSGERNKDIAEFCEYWNTEVYKYVHYITFMSNERPFPFSKMQKIGKFKK